MQNRDQIGLVVPDNAPNEDKIICDLINKGFSARQLLKASSSFYRHELEQKLRMQKHIKVLGGLFSGMLCSTATLSSVLLAKYQGTYECEVQDLIIEWASDADYFLDIGCAEGYYVNGMAYRYGIPSVGVDVNLAAKQLLLETAKANNLTDYVSFSDSIAAALSGKTGKILILVDVDGAEHDVLKEVFESLASALGGIPINIIFIIETDLASNNKQNTPDLINFLVEHGALIQSIARQDPLRRFSNFSRHLSFMDQWVAGLEGRGAGQQWIVAEWPPL